jgi:general secretion pathway protein D
LLLAGQPAFAQNPPAAVPKPTPSAAAPAQTAPAQTTPAQTAPPPAPAPAHPAIQVPAGLNLTNASLTEVIDILARDLKINYVLDPKVQGKVTINTYGELHAVDVRNLLETILRMNKFSMVQVGNIFRIVPAADAAQLPVDPQMDIKSFGDTEQVVLDLIFLKYVTSAEMSKLLEPFLGEGYKMVAYDPANLLIIQDNARNMKRTVELIGMFDSESIAGQRVKSYTLTNARPSDVAHDLDTIFKAYAFSEKNSALKFIPIDRIGTIIAVAANPASFKDVSTWIEKLDVPVKLTAGEIEDNVYKLKYGRAEVLGTVIAQLYGASVPGSVNGYGLTRYGGYSGNLAGGGNFGNNPSLGGGYGGGGSFGSPNTGGYGVNGLGAGAYGNSMGSQGMAASALSGQAVQTGTAASAPVTTTPFGAAVPAGSDQSGQYLAPSSSAMTGIRPPRIIPNPYDNTLLVQGTPQQWQSILHLLEQLDVPPRQVLIDARIYEVDLTGDLSYGVEALLQARDNTSRQLTGSSNTTNSSSGATNGLLLNVGTLVGRSRELLGYVNALQTDSRAKSISAPQLICTDSIPASITVGEEVPTLSATSVSTGLGGTTTSAVQNVGTGTNLNIIARVNSSGVVTLVVDQDISAPEATQAGLGVAGSPSFSRRNVSTQVTIEDGDTIAIGGIIQDSTSVSTSGIPVLSHIPWIGGLFGTTNYSKNRTELILFLTPHVIYDTNQIADATEELKSRMKNLKKDIRDQ